MLDTGDFFTTQDRYLYEPFERAMFFWDHEKQQAFMKLSGWTYTTPVEQSHRIFNDAILSGIEISKEEFEAGQINC